MRDMDISIKSVKKVNVVGEVFEQMKNIIIIGKWEPGKKIPSETELSSNFNVSRNTIRSAIQKLKGMGLVISHQGQGTYVCKDPHANAVDTIVPFGYMTEREVFELAQFRRSLEMGSVYFAAINRTDKDLERIHDMLVHMKESQDDFVAYGCYDYKFHTIIAEASKNRYFHRMYVILKDAISLHFGMMARDFGAEMSYENHEVVFNAIKNRDPEVAMQKTKEMIDASLGLLEKKLNQE